VLPSGIDWDDCSIRIKERQIKGIPKLIDSKLDDWSRMASNARNVFVSNFADQAVVGYMVKNIDQMRVSLLKDNFKAWHVPLYSVKIAGAYMVHHSTQALGVAKRHITDKLRMQ
jgi:hypothetical protein